MHGASDALEPAARGGEHPLPSKGVTTPSLRAAHELERVACRRVVGEESEARRTAAGEPERSGRDLLQLAPEARELRMHALGGGLELVHEQGPRRLQGAGQGARLEPES